jgi:murein DD-endopeptidase MepM/ murein hydrolase activator NlpD
MSFRPPYFLGGGAYFGDSEIFFGAEEKIFSISEPGFFDNYSGINTAGTREVLVEDEEGNLVVKIKPKKREKSIFYIVKSGDNVSKIAHKFGLKVATILNVNELTAKGNLRIGDKIQIPPTDGIYYEVQTGDTLSEIAKAHDVEMAKVIAYNQITPGTIKEGQKVFLPDAMKVFIERKPIARSTDSTKIIQRSSGGTFTPIQSIGFRIRRPTRGVLTQGFHSKHFGIDIGNSLNTPIYAAAAGKIIKSSDGWNYGYGNYIIIDHGNNVQTLYGHMNVREVEEGQIIEKGALIGKMGNTGSVWGPTGIHLHFELRISGRKVNPNNYFST